MKHTVTTALMITLAGSGVITQQVNAQDKAKKEIKMSPAATKLWQNFTNLPEEKRKEFNKGISKAQSLFNQKRIFDALSKVAELESIFANHPASLSIQGACYIEMRDFANALKVYEETLRLMPHNTGALFNIAEIHFVTMNWQNAHNKISELLTKFTPSTKKELVRLCEFKLLLCKLKLGQIDQAITLQDKYDKWDDSPFYYYSRAAILDHQGDKEASMKTLKECYVIWNSVEKLASWQDTIMEYGLVLNSFTDDPAKNIQLEDNVDSIESSL